MEFFMGRFIVEGGKKLQGTVEISGNKNEALPLVAASLLSTSNITLENMPNIGDVRDMLKIAEALGASVNFIDKNIVHIHTPEVTTSSLPVELSEKIRASILFASSLLVRTGQAIISEPGGDTIGRRRIDTHFHVFEALGAKIREVRQDHVGLGSVRSFIVEAPKGLKGTDIYLDEASVTGTENAVIAAAGAEGTTTIANAACEPHVQGVCRFLQSLGVKIEGIGSNVLTIHGQESFTSSTHKVGSDYIEAGSFISLAACTNSDITLTNVNPTDLRMVLLQFKRLGIQVETNPDKHTIRIPDNQELVVKKDYGSAIPRIEDNPWPGFPADLTSIIVVTATQAEGTCIVHEKMFESRLFFVDKLIGMRAQIVLCDPHRAVIVGKSVLHGGTISSPDIRAGMALLIAALSAEGQSIIHNIVQIDRGYERIDERLNALGAQIRRVD